MSLLLHLTLVAGLIMSCSTPAGTVPRPVFCEALLATGATAPRAATTASIEDARRLLTFTTAYKSLRQNQLITDVSRRRAIALDRDLRQLELATVNLRDDVFVGREFRGFDEVAAARALFAGELDETLAFVTRRLADRYSDGRLATHLRHATSFALGLTPLYLLQDATFTGAGLLSSPLAAAAILANELGGEWARARKHGVPGLARQLAIVDRVLNERERLDRGARALSILHGELVIPTFLHRAFLSRGRRGLTPLEYDALVRASEPQVRTWADAPTGDERRPVRRAHVHSIFYTEAYSAEPRWLIYYREARGGDSGSRITIGKRPAGPVRTAVRGLLPPTPATN